MKRQIFIIAVFIFTLLASGQPAYAAVRCETQYGGGQVCVVTGQLQINKQVCDPDKGKCDPNDSGFNSRLVDNLGITSHKFAPGEEVVFKLTIKNVGDATLTNVNVADTLPSFLTPTSGDFNFQIPSLAPGKTEERIIKAKVIGADRLPNDRTVCDVNVAEVVSGDQRDRDTAQACAERRVGAPAQILPKAGIEDWIIPLFTGLIIAGFMIRKRLAIYR